MGIPKFYRWISERYPCLSEKLREYQIPDFDNLYLDMNGIIHSCSHPNDDDIHLRISEEVIFREIFRYIDYLFRMIKPKKVFFMAIDGVAPRAKMNQQRGRRFRSAKLALDQEAEAIKKGEKLPEQERFDSNCITPGTEFMAKLHEQLKYFVQVKISTDPLWQQEGLCIYLSGHDVPGEGEHKIMDFIRHLRSQEDYHANTRHCLYGLDADLIMLGLSTHELHFSLLREEVKFGTQKKRRSKKDTQPPLNNGDTKFDLSNVSVFKASETTEATTIVATSNINHNNMMTVDNTILPAQMALMTLFPQATHTYSGAVKTMEVSVQKQPESSPPCTGSISGPKILELANLEKSLMPPPSEKELRKDTYHPPLPEKTNFLLLHLSLLRDYIDAEFEELKSALNDHPHITYDLECLIDDWILMSILVGNDFVPNLPNLHINNGALPMLYNMYMRVLPKLDGYINENGILRLNRFEVFLKELSEFDVEHFRQTYDDMKYMASKTGKNIVLGEKMFDAFEFDDKDDFNDDDEELEGPVSAELQALINRTNEAVEMAVEDSGNDNEDLSAELFDDYEGLFDEEEDTPEFRLEFVQYKRHYYKTKIEPTRPIKEEIKAMVVEYVQAIQWVLLYYYKGVSSWCWYYPYHYSPFSSDLRNFKDYEIIFDKGQPFRPFEQLLAVLPSYSKKLLPMCYQWLMINEDSPIKNYYPEVFNQDLNGKKQDWEAVVVIPFIDEQKLIQAMEVEAAKLNNEEVFRNSRGKMLMHTFTKEDTGPVESPGNIFPPLSVTHVKVDGITEVNYDPLVLPKGVHPKAQRDKIYQGFPTIKSIQHTCSLENAKVKVFDFLARDVSMVLDLSILDEQERTLNCETVARELLGKTVWVNWPHLTQVSVTGVSDTDNNKYTMSEQGVIKKDPTYKTQDVVTKGLIERHMKYKGIKLGLVKIVLWANMMEGRKVRCDRFGNMKIENLWGKIVQPFAHKTTIKQETDVATYSLMDCESKNYQDFFRKGDTVFILEKNLYGAMATVKGHDKSKVKVIVEYSMPVYRRIDEESYNDIHDKLIDWGEENYFSSGDAARMCNMPISVLAKLTGSIFVEVEKGQGQSSPKKKNGGSNKKNANSKDKGDSSQEELQLAQETKRVNVGLDLKFNKRNLKVRGYTAKDNGKWIYSLKTVKLVQEYAKEFPEFINFMKKACLDRDMNEYQATAICPNDPKGKIRQLEDWLDSRGLRDAQRIDISANIMDEDEIQLVWNHILATKLNAEHDKKLTKSTPPHLLFKPGLDRGNVQPGNEARVTFELLDRVVCVDQSATMPLGQRGTIVGIQQPEVQEEAATIEESFKTTNASMLETLVILCDPQPDVFEKPSEMLKTNSSKETNILHKKLVSTNNMTSSLNVLLGIGDTPNVGSSLGASNSFGSKNISTISMTSTLNELLGIGNGSNAGLSLGALNTFGGSSGGVSTRDGPVSVDQNNKSQSVKDYKPVPRLVKLFPFQVLKITGCEVQSYKEERSKKPKAEQKIVVLKRQPNEVSPNNNSKNIPPLFPPQLKLKNLQQSILVQRKQQLQPTCVEPKQVQQQPKDFQPIILQKSKQQPIHPEPKQVQQQPTHFQPIILQKPKQQQSAPIQAPQTTNFQPIILQKPMQQQQPTHSEPNQAQPIILQQPTYSEPNQVQQSTNIYLQQQPAEASSKVIDEQVAIPFPKLSRRIAANFNF